MQPPQTELPAAKWAALIAFSPCFIYQSAQYAGSLPLSHILPGFSCLEMGTAIWRGAPGCCQLPLGLGGRGHQPLRLPTVGSRKLLAWPCHAAVTQPPLCQGDGVPRCERKDGAVRLTFPELGEHF